MRTLRARLLRNFTHWIRQVDGLPSVAPMRFSAHTQLHSALARTITDHVNGEGLGSEATLVSFPDSLGPRPFFGEEKRPGAICSRMREKLRKITVKSLV